MPELKASKEVMKELREVHAGLHSAMDLLMKTFDPAEAGRILILVDSRLTSLVNRLDIDVPEAAEAPKPKAAVASPMWTTDMLQRFYERSGVQKMLFDISFHTGKRLFMRSVPDGFDLAVEGLAEPLGTVRLAKEGLAKIVYAPRVGLRAFKLEPDPAEFERWVQSIIDVWQTAMANVEQRRQEEAAAAAAAQKASGAEDQPE